MGFASIRYENSSFPPWHEDVENFTFDDFDPRYFLRSICKRRRQLTRYEESELAYKPFIRGLHELYDPVDQPGRISIWPKYLGLSMAAIDRAMKEERADSDGDYEHREAQTEHQFNRVHQKINNLVDDLVKQAYFDEVPDDPELARRNIESLDSAWTAIRLLRSEGYPRYTPVQHDPIAAREARNKLSETIDRLFEQNRHPEQMIKPKFQVAKICHGLLVCPFPPSIHHYNALILGFSQQNMPNLVDLVAVSLLRETRLRSTTQTIVCLLVHYRKTGDVHGFFHIVRRLMAIDTRGLLRTRRRLARRWKVDAFFRSWWRENDVIFSFRGLWAMELPERTLDVYEALISGLLSFGRNKDAVKVLLASIQEGVGISLHLFIQVFLHSMYRLNRPASEMLVCGLRDHLGVVAPLLLIDDGPRRLAEYLWSLLVIWQPSGDLSEERVDIAQNSRWMFLPRGGDARGELLKTAIFIRRAEQTLNQLDTILRFADKMTLSNSPIHRTKVAAATVRRLNEQQEMQDVLAKRAMKHRKLFRLVHELERATWNIKTNNVLRTHMRVTRILQRHIRFMSQAGSPEHIQHVERLEQLADHWIRYRVRKKQDIVGQDEQMRFEIEVSLYYGERLIGEALSWAMPSLAWRRLELESPEQTNTSNAGNSSADTDAWAGDETEPDWLMPGSGLLLN